MSSRVWKILRFCMLIFIAFLVLFCVENLLSYGSTYFKQLIVNDQFDCGAQKGILVKINLHAKGLR